MAAEAVALNAPDLGSQRPSHNTGAPLDVPAEIWLLVAQFIPYEDLVRLLGLNRVFLGLVMDRRYRELRLMDYPNRFMEKIENLQQGTVTRRVQILTIAPQNTWEAINYQSPPTPNSIQERRPASGSQITLNDFSNSSTEFEAISGEDHCPVTLSAAEKRDKIVRAAQMLLNARDLRMMWTPKVDGYNEIGSARYFRPLCPFMEAFLPVFGHNIRALSLTIPASVMSSLTLDTSTFGNLEEIYIKFDGEQSQGLGPCFSPCMVSFLPLINGSSRTLKFLSIEAMGLLGNLSMFFNAMAQFPVLMRLSLIMPLGPALLPDPSGLNRLLNHAIHDLVIRFKYGPSLVAPYTATDVSDWYDRVVQGVSFNTLQRIQLGFFSSMNRELRRHYQSPLRPLFQRLTSLSVVDVHLSLEEVPMTLAAFNGRLLRQLSLVVKVLCLPLIDTIAIACPHLNQLCIYYDTLKDPIQGSLCTASRFCAKMNELQTSSTWGLSDIDIWMTMPPDPRNPGERKRKRQWDVMRSISMYIPAITSFAGQGHMRDITDGS